MVSNGSTSSKPDETPGGWRSVIDGWVGNDKVRRDALIGLGLVLLATVVIIALVANVVIAVTTAMVTVLLGWRGKQALRALKARRKS